MVQPPLLFVDVAEWQTRKIQNLVGNRVGSTPIIDTIYFNKKEELNMMKELVMEVTNSLPDSATFDDIIEAIYTRLKIEKGLEDTKKGNEITTDELLKEIKKW